VSDPDVPPSAVRRGPDDCQSGQPAPRSSPTSAPTAPRRAARGEGGAVFYDAADLHRNKPERWPSTPGRAGRGHSQTARRARRVVVENYRPTSSAASHRYETFPGTTPASSTEHLASPGAYRDRRATTRSSRVCRAHVAHRHRGIPRCASAFPSGPARRVLRGHGHSPRLIERRRPARPAVETSCSRRDRQSVLQAASS